MRVRDEGTTQGRTGVRVLTRDFFKKINSSARKTIQFNRTIIFISAVSQVKSHCTSERCTHSALIFNFEFECFILSFSCVLTEGLRD